MSAPALNLSTALRPAILAHLQSCLPEEGCGLIGGLPRQGTLWLAIPNELHSTTAFRMQPQPMLDALQFFAQQGLELVAICHSHPCGPLWPSPQDQAAFAYPGVWTVIAAPTQRGWRLRAFCINRFSVKSGQILWTNAHLFG